MRDTGTDLVAGICGKGRFPILVPRHEMLNTLQGLSLLTMMEIVGTIALGVAIAYGTLKASRRPQGKVEQESVRATREHFREED